MKFVHILIVILLALLVIIMIARRKTANSAAPSGGEVRPPAVAGKFYSDDAEQLRQAVNFFLEDAAGTPEEDPVAIIVPHAGYVFSGQIAADAFKQVEGKAFSTVIVLGTNHTSPAFRGASVWQRGAFRTPLGDVPIDEELAQKIASADEDFAYRADVHAQEHSIEVELPFIQTVLPGAQIVPIVIGTSDFEFCKDLGNTIAELTRDKSVLIVASSDLSHYPDYDDATVTDKRVLAAISTMEPREVKNVISEEMSRGVPGLATCACGEGPILTAMFAAKKLNAERATVISYANSGDTPLGEMDRVVGYGAVVLARGPKESDVSGLEMAALEETEVPLSEEEQQKLLALARESIDQYIRTGTAPLARPDDVKLYQKRGAFVTLKDHGRLRGCIGHMSEDRPLCQVVGAMALQAAFNDRRFRPVTPDEWKNLSIEISALTPYKKINGVDEIVIGRDGVLLRKRGHSAVFLPQVAPEQGWNLNDLLEHLCAKAGLGNDCWKDDAELFIFQAEVFSEEKH
ncbi:AmmeMemoRadiSam system protein B [bacterium]|nr:AmmeMemoRadiSam system protein B [bacterium]